MEIPPEVLLAIDREVTKAKEEARKEAEKARNQAIGVLAFVSLVLSLAGALGISQTIKAHANAAAAAAVKSSLGQEFLGEAEHALFRAKTASETVEAYRDEAAKRLQDLQEAEAWIAAQLGQDWQPYLDENTPFNPPAYFKDSFGVVHLRGLVKGDRGTIFTLPVDYQPDFRTPFVVPTDNHNLGRVDILSSGEVILIRGIQWVSLDSITFRAARQGQSKTTTAPSSDTKP